MIEHRENTNRWKVKIYFFGFSVKIITFAPKNLVNIKEYTEYEENCFFRFFDVVGLRSLCTEAVSELFGLYREV